MLRLFGWLCWWAKWLEIPIALISTRSEVLGVCFLSKTIWALRRACLICLSSQSVGRGLGIYSIMSCSSTEAPWFSDNFSVERGRVLYGSNLLPKDALSGLFALSFLYWIGTCGCRRNTYFKSVAGWSCVLLSLEALFAWVDLLAWNETKRSD